MEYLLWQIDSKDMPAEFKQAVTAYQRRTGQPANVILVRTLDVVEPPAGVQCVESAAVAPSHFWVTGDK